jgi:hypothetical protein
MSKEFNYERAWRELYEPAFVALPEDIHRLIKRTAKVAPNLVQDQRHLETLVWVSGCHAASNDGLAAFTVLKEEFGKFAGLKAESLANASEIVHAHGHLDPTCHSVGGMHKDGLYWKFQKLAVAALVETQKGCEALRQAKIKYEQLNKGFMDHKEGSGLDDEEVAEKYAPLIENAFAVVKVACVNFKPHPFVIGMRHFPKDGGMYLDPTSAPCAHCDRPYAEHTHDRVMIIKLKKDLKNAEVAPLLQKVVDAAKADKTRLDGFAMEPSEFKILPADKTPIGQS